MATAVAKPLETGTQIVVGISPAYRREREQEDK